MNTCSIEGCNYPVWSKKLCQNHYPKTRLSPGNSLKSKPKIEETNKMHEFFLSIWKKRMHLSELDGYVLHDTPLSTYFHHILPKKNYPQAAFDEENIILLNTHQHGNVEIDCFRYPEINKRRIYLLKKYNL